ncbi:Glutathione S-transferase/chloride channel C-terminal [Penicillium cf. viridicatum]|uniref:Glutathione S-transferase/chloride channel C-terminal n=1 Tax=Penicillium cf. viridicatum TaxID=2972119 RepID=A0A9W9IYY3_9EURO|nr:Glutathione S-transferase/chloride channel C-terminal [Penicillium cf. viridicatum]
MAINNSKTYHLYSYFRSTCTNRVVIAMHLKGITIEHTYIDLGKAEHESPEFQALNPSKSVPILIIKEDGNETRARVREMVNIITNDIQPITNGRIAKRVRAIRGEAKVQITFVTEIFLAGLTAYEELLAKYGGQFSVGDVVTMADVCFAPAVEMALAYGTNLDGLTRVMGLFKKLGELPAFQKGNWKVQGDTPEAMRAS